MNKKLMFFSFLVLLFSGFLSPVFLPVPILSGEQADALEKLSLGTPVKMYPPYYLPPLVAEEKGFWKENGLDTEWVPFAGGSPLVRAIAARAINIAYITGHSPWEAGDRGLPMVMVAELVASDPFIMWVRADTPYRHPRDLKGTRLGLTTLGSVTQAYGQIIFRAHGVEKEVRFVGAGGVPEQLAGLRVGAFQSIIMPLATLVNLKLEGAVREVASMADYLPKPWFDQVVVARKDFVQSKPEIVRKVVRATLQATDHIRKNPRYALDKMKGFQGLSEEAAKLVYDTIRFTSTGRFDRKAVENARRVYIEYGVLTEKTGAVDDVFTNEYLPSG